MIIIYDHIRPIGAYTGEKLCQLHLVLMWVFLWENTLGAGKKGPGKNGPGKKGPEKRVPVKTVLGKNGPGKKGPSDYFDLW